MIKMRIRGLLLTAIGVLGIISYAILPNLIEEKAETEYDKYYEQAKSNLKCDKTEIEVICTEATEEIDINTNSSVMSYSFSTEGGIGQCGYTYYDTGVKYKKNDTYDCTLYSFSCRNKLIHEITCIEIFVIGEGTTSNINKSFDFDKEVDECLETFALQYIEDKPKEYSEQLSWLIIVSLILLFEGVILFLFSFSKEYRE